MPLPLLPTQILDLTKMSQEEMNARLESLAAQVIPQWSDFSLGFPENVLKEAQALLTSMAVSTMNERFRQLSMATVTDRLAAIRLGRPFGYEMMSATAAQIGGAFVLPNAALATKQINITAGTRIVSNEAQYCLYSAAVINPGSNTTGALTLENSEEQVDTFISDESVNMVLRLSKSPYVEGSISVSAANGVFTTVGSTGKSYKSFTEAGPSSLAMIVRADNQGRLYVFFGDSINGAIPRGTITCTYRVGGGEAGRISAVPATWKILDAIYDVDGSPVTLQFVNSATSVGGYGATTVEQARIEMPLSVRTVERAVNESDFEYVATRVAGIATAALITSNHDPSMAEDIAYLYLVAYGTPYSDSGYYPPLAPTTNQIASVQALIAEDGEYEALMGGVVTVLPATFLDVTVDVRIYKASGFTATQVSDNITEELQKFFAIADDTRALNSRIDFGFRLLDADGDPDYKLAWSDIFNAIRDAEGVREISYATNNLLLNGAHQSVILQPNEFPRLSSITIRDMDQSGALI